jgi:arsenite/tail-anchored protein-transporting ATPase
MALTGLHNADLKLVLFGGKGGVGKTSCAAATAITLANDFKTLLISTDPAHSVSDSLGAKSGNEIAAFEGINNLWTIEIAADEAFVRFKSNHEQELKKLLETSTNLDDEDIGDLLKLTIPGIDEIMSFKSIIDFIEEGNFEKYVVDMAPSGHALRLITSPALLDQWIKVASKMRWKYRYMITSFSGKYQPDPTDAMLLDLKKTVKKIELLFSDNTKCEFILVCIPEAMAVAETGRLIKDLKRFKIEVKQLVVNNVMMDPEEGCSFCKQRKQGQQKHLDNLKAAWPGFNIVQVPLFAREISGLKSLEKLREFLFHHNQKK